jgi:NAD(P)-dependent dehydrogenase (short-subunit alcohol dehydrogenase family)
MTKWTTASIPDQTGRTAVITGANTGLGFETAKALAASGARVVFAVRNPEMSKFKSWTWPPWLRSAAPPKP